LIKGGERQESEQRRGDQAADHHDGQRALDLRAVEAVWSGVALRRWRRVAVGSSRDSPSPDPGLPLTLLCSYTVGVSDLLFDWDEAKNKGNQRKHAVSFEEAQTVFSDDHALFMEDPDHSESEDRFVLLGLSSRLRTLVVCHCHRDREDLIRIISARKADREERALYNHRWTQ
jgi:uncharacterized DUF497 family protein